VSDGTRSSNWVNATLLLAVIGQSIFLGRWSRGIEDRQDYLADSQAAARQIQVQQAAEIEYLKKIVADQQRDFLLFKDYTKGRIARFTYHEYQSQ
jgi:hypothetical protein